MQVLSYGNPRTVAAGRSRIISYPEVGFSLPAERAIRTLEQIIEWRGITRSYIPPGKPQQNAYIERF